MKLEKGGVFLKKENKRNRVILTVAIIVVIGGFILGNYLISRVTLYDDPQTIGNTGGNLNNGGLFCESDGQIFFSNVEDEGKLYVMSSDLTKVKKVYDDHASYINAAGKYIFYTRRNDQIGSGAGFLTFSNTGLYRIKKNGKSIGRLYNDPTQAACLYGNYVYYQHYDKSRGLQLYKAKIDSSEDTLLLEEGVMPCSIDTYMIYYSGTEDDHAIYSLSVNTEDKEKIYDGNCYLVTANGNYLYYIDLDADYSLARIEKNGENPEILIDSHIATYNITADGSTIYYQVDDGEENGLYAYSLANKESQLLQSGNYNYLHLTTDYLFFEMYDQSKMYVMNLSDQKIEDFVPSGKK